MTDHPDEVSRVRRVASVVTPPHSLGSFLGQSAMGTVHWSAAASALPCRLSPAVRGQGALFVGRSIVSALPRR
ncbi:hypothetical protein GW17_00015013 [Ensete ventricosum]|nr:hypothetical protein GW17_00015013 [Ensete ventricosum]